MKILFIEADKWLDDYQEKFGVRLKSLGNEVLVITDCYNNPKTIKDTLIEWKPNVIFVQTTFVYLNKIESLIPLTKFIAYPVELWFAGSHMDGAQFIIDMIPQEKQHLFTGFNVWPMGCSDGLEDKYWKKPTLANTI